MNLLVEKYRLKLSPNLSSNFSSLRQLRDRGRGSVKGELLLPDSLRGVQRNPAIMCDFGFGFRQKTGFGSKLVSFNLRTSS